MGLCLPGDLLRARDHPVGCIILFFHPVESDMKLLCLFYIQNLVLAWRVNVCIGNWKALETFRLGLFCVYTKPL